ncbi:replication protein A 70 kDa DNA-binding subunit B-like [Abeliophyllum distichum]|uniref:Replication protein A 70 kDa DNA-binding subunit B-like n=1 Tax=Abeliophyllum distichum TaxID=126358 RepID=A0ABD1Q368_9LAMI
MVTTEDHDKCVLELRKKEQRNKRRRERNAEARREELIQVQHHDRSSHVAAAEKRLLRNRQRREVNAKKKELREQEYARLQGVGLLQNKRSKRLVQLASSRGLVVDCSVEGSIDKGNDIVGQRIHLHGEHFTSTENEFPARCEGVLHDQGSTSGSIMAFQPKLIPDVSPGQTSWTAKVVVAEKNVSRTAQRSPVKYQNMVLVDPQGNKVHATIYNNDITAFQDTLLLSKTYLISNATVRHTDPKYKATAGPVQWTINGRTRIEELDEKHDDLVFSTYDLVSFDNLQEYMDSKDEIGVVGLAIGILPKKVVQTKNGSESHIQEIILVNERFQTVLLRMWDRFVDNECHQISAIMNDRPVILGKNLRVSSFNGMAVSTKANSSIVINPSFQGVHYLTVWADENVEKLEEVVSHKTYLHPSMSINVHPPAKHKIQEIKDIPHLLSEENESVTKSIRTSVDDEHILYVRATERSVDGIQVKYDVVFLIDPVTELDTPMRRETSSDVNLTFRRTSFSRGRKGKQIVKPIKRTLFSLKDSDSSQDEEHEGLNDSTIPSQLVENRDHNVVGDLSEEDDVPVQQQFETTVLTAWDEFVVNQCTAISAILTTSPVILATNLRVSSFNGLGLCTKSKTSIYINPPFKQLTLLHSWVDDSIEILETIRSKKSYLTSTSKSIAHPPAEMIVLIKDVPRLLTEGNEDLLNHIRTSTTEEHVLYVKAVNNSRRCTRLKYDIIFMLNPILSTITCSSPTNKTSSSVMLQTVNTDCAGINRKADEQLDLTILSLEASNPSKQADKHIGYKIIKDIGFHEAPDLFLHPAIVGHKDEPELVEHLSEKEGPQIVRDSTVNSNNFLIIRVSPVKSNNFLLARKTIERAIHLRQVDEQVNKDANKVATGVRVADVKAIQNMIDGKFCDL